MASIRWYKTDHKILIVPFPYFQKGLSAVDYMTIYSEIMILTVTNNLTASIYSKININGKSETKSDNRVIYLPDAH